MKNQNKPLKFKYRVNEYIRVPRITLIDEDGNMAGEVPTYEALQRAKGIGLDLVEVNPNNRPPICKILDYGKMLYNIKKAQKNTKQTETKMIKIRYNTDENDLNIKGKKIREFLNDKNPVKITIQLKGRENQYRDIAKKRMQEYANTFEDIAQINPKLQESKNSITIELKPK